MPPRGPRGSVPCCVRWRRSAAARAYCAPKRVGSIAAYWRALRRRDPSARSEEQTLARLGVPPARACHVATHHPNPRVPRRIPRIGREVLAQSERPGEAEQAERRDARDPLDAGPARRRHWKARAERAEPRADCEARDVREDVGVLPAGTGEGEQRETREQGRGIAHP